MLFCLCLGAVATSALAQEITTEPLPGDEQPASDGAVNPDDPNQEGGLDAEEEAEEEEIDPANVYTVTDIPVDVTAATTTAAREQAFSEGQRQGLLLLGEELQLPVFPLTVGRLSDDAISQLVRSFSVANERTLPGRYIADMTFVYEPEAMRRLLRDGYISTYQPANQELVVVIPVYDAGAGSAPRLWDPPNPWFDAWLNFDPGSLPTQILVPYGELQDVADLPAEAAVAPDTLAIAKLAARYSAGRSVVAVARPLGGNLSVSLNGISATGQTAVDTLNIPLTAGLTGAAAMGQAVQEVARYIDAGLFAAVPQRTGLAPAAGSGNATALTLSVPIQAPSDWYKVLNTLGQLPMIVGNSLVSLGPREAIVRIEHLGSQEQLRTALATHALDLQFIGGVMELRPIAQ